MFSFRSEGVSRSEGIWAGSAHREGEGGVRSEGVSKSEGTWAGSARGSQPAHSEGEGGVRGVCLRLYSERRGMTG